MPLVQIKGIGGYLSIEQKRQLIKNVTGAVVTLERKGLRSVTWDTIEDVPKSIWGVDIQPISDDGFRKKTTSAY